MEFCDIIGREGNSVKRIYENYYNKYVTFQLENTQKSAKTIVLEKNLQKNFYMSIIFFALNLYYLIVDAMQNYYHESFNLLNLSALILILISTAFLIIVYLIYRKKPCEILARISMLMFYLCLIASITIIAYTSNVKALYAGVDPSHVGITLSTFYLIVFVIAPLGNIEDTVIALSAMIIASVIPEMLVGRELYQLFPQLSLRVIVVVGSLYFRKQDRRMAEHNMELDKLCSDLLKTSFLDNLTGALNRNALSNMISRMATDEMVKEVGVIMFDIDYFKMFNDNYSHQEGDNALRRVSEAVIDEMDDNSYLFRFGGEEFIVVTDKCDNQSLKELGLRVRQAVLDENIKRSDIEECDRLTISVGCACVDLSLDESLNDYVSQADKQMYLSKNNGKDCVAVDDKLYR